MSANDDLTAGIDAAIDSLYQAPLDQFTASRNSLVSELKTSGRADDADGVKALPKPSVTAWAVNQAWWRDRPAFQAMLDAGEALRSAHVARLQGTSADVRAAAEARQEAIKAVVDAAVDALGGPNEVAPDARYRIAGTIEALASSGVPAGMVIGRLTRDLQASGFEALSALTGIGPAPSARTPEARPAPRPVIVSRTDQTARPATREAREEARAEAAARERALRIADAKSSLAEREAALRTAKADAAGTISAEKKARAALETATARVADLEDKLDKAREHEREARRALAHATKAASEAEMIHARAVRDVNAARERLQELPKA